MRTRYIFVTGGVVSSLGKGIAAASIGKILSSYGFRVAFLKMDPYLNIDPGTMSPNEHGEVFVTEDGHETDLDLGHYERFGDMDMRLDNNITSGRIYFDILDEERRGKKYLGRTIQIVPDVTDAIIAHIRRVGRTADILITEIGGTVGDIEGMPFLEAIRQLHRQVGDEEAMFVHVTLVPFLKAAKEHKTKPTQHSVRELRQTGINPDVILCRTEIPIDKDLRKKIARHCDIPTERVIENMDQASIYEVPKHLRDQGIGNILLKHLKLEPTQDTFDEWQGTVERLKNVRDVTYIGVVGKYSSEESYFSMEEALTHAGVANDTKVELTFIDAEKLTPEYMVETLQAVHGIIVPGGFSYRGVEGKILAIRMAREQGIPFFGLCLGLQCAVIEFARNMAGIGNATSEEFEEGEPGPPVIMKQPSQVGIEYKGKTMRLGAYPCDLKAGSRAHQAYGTETISERHRHRYEVNPAYVPQLVSHGLVMSGICPTNGLVEIVELPDHPWFVGVQFHPEFKSKLNAPHPLFREFVAAAARRHRKG